MVRQTPFEVMIARIIEILSGFIVATIAAMGYSGVVLLMAIESACIPLPSEIIMGSFQLGTPECAG